MADSDDSGDKECPLCMEPFELDDINFYPCTCEYQICRFCWHRLRTDENGLCPACRQPYPENPVNFEPLSSEELKKIALEKKQKELQRKQRVSESRKHLTNLRVVQKNLVFVVGLASRLADSDILKRSDYFGKFGKIQKIMVNNQSSYIGQQGPSASAYITYLKPEDALRAIQCVNNLQIDGRTMKACLGTTKYCSVFLKNQACNKPDCMYLHELGDDAASFTKEEMQQGKHTEYERRLIDQMVIVSNAGQRVSESSSCLTWCSNSGDSSHNGRRDNENDVSDAAEQDSKIGLPDDSIFNLNPFKTSNRAHEKNNRGTTKQHCRQKKQRSVRSRSPKVKHELGTMAHIPPRLMHLHGHGENHHRSLNGSHVHYHRGHGKKLRDRDQCIEIIPCRATRSASADLSPGEQNSCSTSPSPGPASPECDKNVPGLLDSSSNAPVAVAIPASKYVDESSSSNCSSINMTSYMPLAPAPQHPSSASAELNMPPSESPLSTQFMHDFEPAFMRLSTSDRDSAQPSRSLPNHQSYLSETQSSPALQNFTSQSLTTNEKSTDWQTSLHLSTSFPQKPSVSAMSVDNISTANSAHDINIRFSNQPVFHTGGLIENSSKMPNTQPQSSPSFPSSSFPSLFNASPTSSRNNASDDDLGFDPFAESSKGLEAMMQLEKQQESLPAPVTISNSFDNTSRLSTTYRNDRSNNFNNFPWSYQDASPSKRLNCFGAQQAQKSQPLQPSQRQPFPQSMFNCPTEAYRADSSMFSSLRMAAANLSPLNDPMRRDHRSPSTDKYLHAQNALPDCSLSNGFWPPFTAPNPQRPPQSLANFFPRQQNEHPNPMRENGGLREWQDGLRQLLPNVNVQFAQNFNHPERQRMGPSCDSTPVSSAFQPNTAGLRFGPPPLRSGPGHMMMPQHAPGAIFGNRHPHVGAQGHSNVANMHYGSPSLHISPSPSLWNDASTIRENPALMPRLDIPNWSGPMPPPADFSSQ